MPWHLFFFGFFCLMAYRKKLNQIFLTMSTLYWIHVLGSLSTVASILATFFGIVTVFLIIAYMVNKYDDKPEVAKVCGRWSIGILFLFIFNTIVSVFIPSKEELYLIYGVGGTIDYLRNNPTAAQLPDKTIKMLDLMADEYIDKHTDGSDTTKTNN